MENYSDAAFRHWKDAKLLEKENCVENADHHFGFAAECAVKKVLVELPAFKNAGMLEKSYKEHINILWEKVSHQSLQKSYPALFAILRAANSFSDWNVNQRYSEDGEITKAMMESHKKSASRILGAIGFTGNRGA
ncbi:MAG: hypothetical protein I8H91_14640 [Burkholderiales bacterium]|nr:hypothetical protein [Burkholderiales bacterium]